MEKIIVPFANGFYESDMLPVSAQSCINFYPVTEDAPSLQQETLRGTPGIKQIDNTGGTSSDKCRGGHVLDGTPYFVIGTGLYRLETDETLTSLGTISGTKRCTFADNGTQLFVMQANGNGYIFTESPDTLTQITDADYTTTNGTPQSVVFVDGYFVVTTDAKKFIVSALNDGLSWDALDFGTAESSPDGVVTPVVFQNQLFIGGERTMEGFTNIGGSGFPFQRSGLFLDVGISSVYSVTNAPNTFVWLGAGENQEPAIWKFEGNAPVKISTRAIDSILAGLNSNQLEKVFAWTYAQGGNYFVGFNTHKTTTVVYDLTTGKWHERRSYYTGYETDGNAWRAACILDAYGKLYVGDQYSYKVGILDPDVADEMDETTTTNRIYREFATMPFQNNMKNMFVPQIELLVEGGLDDAEGYPDSYAECEDYACDALDGGITADHVFPLTSFYYTGVTPHNYATPDTVGGQDARTHASTVDPTPAIPSSCYGGSWYFDVTSGQRALDHARGGEAGNSLQSNESSQGVIATLLSNTRGTKYFRRQFHLENTWAGLQYPLPVDVFSDDVGGTPSFCLYFGSSGEYGAYTTAWSALTATADPLTPHMVHVDITAYHTGAKTSGEGQYAYVNADVKVYLNNTLIYDETGQVQSSTSNAIYTGAIYENDASWVGSGIVNPGDPYGRMNYAYFNNSIQSDEVRTNNYIVFQRNLVGYTQPTWCPGPKP